MRHLLSQVKKDWRQITDGKEQAILKSHAEVGRLLSLIYISKLKIQQLNPLLPLRGTLVSMKIHFNLKKYTSSPRSYFTNLRDQYPDRW